MDVAIASMLNKEIRLVHDTYDENGHSASTEMIRATNVPLLQQKTTHNSYTLWIRSAWSSPRGARRYLFLNHT